MHGPGHVTRKRVGGAGGARNGEGGAICVRVCVWGGTHVRYDRSRTTVDAVMCVGVVVVKRVVAQGFPRLGVKPWRGLFEGRVVDKIPGEERT